MNLKPISAILDRKITCFKVDKETNEISVNKNHNYFFQIQGQLNVLNRDYCLFVIYCGNDVELKITKIAKDEKFWAEMIPKLEKFYFEQLLPEIINPRLKT